MLDTGRETLYTAKDLAKVFSVNIATIWRWVKNNKDFPKGTLISYKMRVWTQTELAMAYPKLFSAPEDAA